MPHETVVDIGYESVPGENHEESSTLYSDDIILLVVNGKKFTAHRQILASKSPVFEVMFNHDSVEQRERSVEIIDIDPKVFEKFLHYIYKGSVDRTTLNEFGIQLWIAADKVREVCLIVVHR